MEDRAFITNHNFDISDKTIHEFAVAVLLSRQDSESIFTQGSFVYRVKGGDDGYLYYKKGVSGKWVLVANWCFYGLYIVVRYRKPVWLRSMYEILFGKMNFRFITFRDYSIELIDSGGQISRSRRFRLSPPSSFDEVMAEKFGFSQEQVQSLRVKAGFTQ